MIFSETQKTCEHKREGQGTQRSRGGAGCLYSLDCREGPFSATRRIKEQGCKPYRLVPRGDLAPEFVEGNAVEQSGCLNDQILLEPHEPRVSVLVGLPVTPGTFPVPQDDYGVPVSIDPAHGHRPERLGEPSSERPEYLPDELFLTVEGL